MVGHKLFLSNVAAESCRMARNNALFFLEKKMVSLNMRSIWVRRLNE